jgi:glycosyltransferase involved in cell wall biosynthesis
MSKRIVQVFNRYLHPGGEEKSVDRIFAHLQPTHQVTRCLFDSRTWTGPQAPSRLSQARRLFYNSQSRAEFESTVHASRAEVALFHNLYPVASPSLYKSALDSDLPVIQYLHNFRPFSVGGTLYVRGKVTSAPLEGNYLQEVTTGAWQGSIVKSALFAILLKLLHRSGWLKSVRLWIAISDFMRTRLINAGLPSDQIVTLRHSWDAMPQPPYPADAGHYLFLGRLIEEKGIRPLLAAWAELTAHLGPRTPRLIVAGEGPLLSTVQQAAADNPHITCAGHLSGEAKHQALSTCRALLAPSTWWEPLGLVIYEAYDYAKPALAAQAGGLTETVQQGVTGLLHPPGDASALAKDVLTLQQMTPDQRQALGQVGRTWLLQEASPDSWLKLMNQALEQVTASAH